MTHREEHGERRGAESQHLENIPVKTRESQNWSGHMHHCRLVVLSYLSAHKA